MPGIYWLLRGCPFYQKQEEFIGYLEGTSPTYKGFYLKFRIFSSKKKVYVLCQFRWWLMSAHCIRPLSDIGVGFVGLVGIDVAHQLGLLSYPKVYMTGFTDSRVPCLPEVLVAPRCRWYSLDSPNHMDLDHWYCEQWWDNHKLHQRYDTLGHLEKHTHTFLFVVGKEKSFLVELFLVLTKNVGRGKRWGTKSSIFELLGGF